MIYYIKRRNRKKCKKQAVNQHHERLVGFALRPSDGDLLLAEVCCVDNLDRKMAYFKFRAITGNCLVCTVARNVYSDNSVEY